MWETIKNAIVSLKEAAGIKIPGLPADLGSVGESAATAVQTATESTSGVIDGAGAAATDAAATATDAVGGDVAGVTESATTAVDSATQALPDITGGLIGDSPPK